MQLLPAINALLPIFTFLILIKLVPCPHFDIQIISRGNCWRMKEIDNMDMLGFLRLWAWDETLPWLSFCQAGDWGCK
jgi:hypothetical protein